MTSLSDIQLDAWRAVLVDADDPGDSAIYKRWLSLKAQGVAIGVPVAAEARLEDGTAAQAFSSGYVLHWTGGDSVDCV